MPLPSSWKPENMRFGDEVEAIMAGSISLS
jgi:hypothetical protein